MNRRSFLVNAAKAAAVVSTATFFDMGESWAKHGNGLYLRKGDIITLAGVWVVNPQTLRPIPGVEQTFMVTDDHADDKWKITDSWVELQPTPRVPYDRSMIRSVPWNAAPSS